MVMAEAPSLYPDFVERTSPPGKGHHGYYRKANGWISTGGVWPSFKNDMEFKGMRYLPDYGTWLMTSAGGLTDNKDARGNRFNPVDEPWRLIFQRGGAKEFPVSQIIAYHWHLSPPYREVTFPQMEGVEVFDLYCPECEKGTVFSSEVQQTAIDNLRTHLTSQVNDSHKYRPEDLRALGQEYGIDFFAPRRRRAQREETVKAPEPAALDLTPNDTPLERPIRKAGA